MKHMKHNTPPLATAARYARQIALPEIGPAGQAKLRQSRALVVGASGLGSPALLYLAAAGVGVLGVADSDTASASNLNRQILYSENDLGTAKTDAALDRLRRLNSDLTIVTHPVRLTTANAAAIIAEYDVIVDCVDSLAARSLINHAALAAGRDVVEAGIEGFHGFVLSVRRGTACAACVQPAPSPDGAFPPCAAEKQAPPSSAPRQALPAAFRRPNASSCCSASESRCSPACCFLTFCAWNSTNCRFLPLPIARSAARTGERGAGTAAGRTKAALRQTGS